MYSRSRMPHSSRRAFVVRVWWEEDDSGAQTLLRGLLQDAHSQEQMAFASLEELFALLASHVQPPQDDRREPGR